MQQASPDYGIDAPGVRRGMLTAGVVGVILTTLLTPFALHATGGLAAATGLAAGAASVAALYGFGMGAHMTYWSRVGKRRTCERLLDLAQDLQAWTGRESVLDVGCGRGLMLIGSAKRLTTGLATGVDLWRTQDQAGNTPEAALENARREGVADRVRVHTGDALGLRFADASFDVVLSHWVVHNLPSAADRERALSEMLRVLRPGGTLVLADIAHHDTYRRVLTYAGLIDIQEDSVGVGTRFISLLSGGTFRPRALVGRKTAAESGHCENRRSAADWRSGRNRSVRVLAAYMRCLTQAAADYAFG